jgi:phosphoethanolamine N-methyltransferase
MNPALIDDPRINYYSDQLVAHFAQVYSEGFISPGGPAEVTRIVEGIPLDGLDVLDIGCGIGGPAATLVRDCGANSVTGIDIQPGQVERARQYIASQGLSARVSPTLVERGPLPFEDHAFDVVFSKEAINEVDDKFALFQEIYRVLKPGGWLLASDWMSGDLPLSNAFHIWASSMNLPITFERLSTVRGMLSECGFTPVTLTPRSDWYRQEALRELNLMEGPLRKRLMEIHQDERILRMVSAYWRTMLRLLDSGEFCPAHIRARKPS